ncbi:T9SS type A sorting domain-containing protein [Portibacter lacus]|uniref:Secretion system C-terminal sorting domain-containing protein n=1 Tax=Portibacter lacus TaxID=1099794 RepID=A0AA37WI32_9BACT|nr:T9SS type A sorting domain-containing protein [Portibacter lacus]GLR19215.1 hypothetical protein GCM10007940_38310 [Portibacter lacus]
MKNLLITLVLLFVGHYFIFAQNPMVFDQYNSSYVSDLEYVNDSTYVVALRVGNEKNHSTLQWYKDSEFLYDLEYFDRVASLDIRKENDHTYLDYIFDHSCDYIWNGFSTISADTNWVRSEFVLFGNYGESLQAVRISESLIFVLNKNKQLIRPDTNGTSLKTEQINLSGDVILQKLDNKIALLGENESIIKQVKEADSSDIILTHSNNAGLKILNYQSQYYLLGKGNIGVFDMDGQFIKSIEFPDNLRAIDVIIDHDEQLIMLGSKEENNTTTNYLYQLLSDGEWTEIYSIAEPHLNLREIKLKPNNEILLLGSIYETEYRERGFILDIAAPLSYSPDLSIDYLGASITQNENGHDILETSIRVNNLGSTDAYNVNVFSTEYGCHNPSESSCECPKIETSFSFIPANSSVEVNIETSIETTFTLKPELCFYLSGAKQHYDKSFEDNLSCDLLLDTDEVVIKESTFDLYPNPAGHVLRSKSAQFTDAFEIIDLQGRVVMNDQYRTGLNIKNLISGIYYVRNMESNEVSKFIKI